ncbi:MAG: hypothetical protein U0457_15570 [Candidatus Sericytochromatia bacterium]
MRNFIFPFITILLSLFLFSFGVWTFMQSTYQDKIRKDFQEKQEISFEKLKDVKLLSDKIILVKGKILDTDTFNGKHNKKVVIERYTEEKKNINSKKDFKVIKENSYFKTIPFKLYFGDKNNSILVDTYNIEKAFLGEPELKEEKFDTEILNKKLWQFRPNEEIYVMGLLEEKAGEFVITNPNLNKSFFDFSKEPFIITKYKPSEVAIKARDIAKSIFYSSIALMSITIFICVSSIINIVKNKKAQENL